jgi:hypothetical protein
VNRKGRIEARLLKAGVLMFARSYCAERGTTLAEVIGDDVPGSRYGYVASRMPTVARARHGLWTMIRHSLALSYPEIGAIFEVNHTTVLSAVRKCESKLDEQFGRVVA